MRRVIGLGLLAGGIAAGAATPAAAAAAGQSPAVTAAAPQTETPLTLRAALDLARANSQQFRSARLTADLAAEDRKQARAAYLPSVNALGQYIYTEPNGTPSGVFVPNDGPNVYTTWLSVHGDLIAPAKWAEYRSAGAAEALARAKSEVAARGLVVTVVQDYYTLVAAQRKSASARQTLDEAQQFLDITQRLEGGGEVAHSDVVKAQIQATQRRREAQEAEYVALKARLALSVLLFPDFRDQFEVADDLADVAAPVPPLEATRATALETSPDLRAAAAAVQQGSSDVSVARGGLLPSLSFDYFYGISANQFATYNSDGQRLLGSSAQVQLNVPLWSWGASQSKLRQAELRVQAAKADLTLAQRQLQADIIAFHREAEMARDQVASLQQSLDLSTESLQLTLLRYQAGEATVLEVVDAQTTLLDARNAYNDGLVRYRVALASLQTLTGVL
ncbi:MAG TPA: TolC family protein [Vicinamibacterales bacterium]